MSGLRARDVSLPGSHLDVRFTQRFTQQKHVVGRTRCGAPIAPPFDKAAFLADTASHGDWTVNGDLLGGSVQLRDLVLTRAKAAPTCAARSSCARWTWRSLARMRGRTLEAEFDRRGRRPRAGQRARPSAATYRAELIIDDRTARNDLRPRARPLLRSPGSTVASRGARQAAVSLQPPKDPVTIADDTLTMPPLTMTLDTPEGFRGGFVLTGNVTKLTRDPTLAVEARLEPVDLAILQRLVPKVERATGHDRGLGERSPGKASAPSIYGRAARARPGTRSRCTACRARVDRRAPRRPRERDGASRRPAAREARRRAPWRCDASSPRRAASTSARSTRTSSRGGCTSQPADGLGRDVRRGPERRLRPQGAGRPGGVTLPRVSGDVTIGSLSYTRPIALTTDLSTLGTRAEAHGSQRLRPVARRRGVRRPREVQEPVRHQKQPRRGAARNRLGVARGHGHQPTHRAARRAQAQPGRALPLPGERLRRPPGDHPLR